MMINELGNLIDNFVDCSSQITAFISAQPNIQNQIKFNLKHLYDLTKNSEIDSKNNYSLPKLIIDEVDLEQIWQQIEIQNEFAYDLLKTRFSTYSEKLNSLPSISSKHEDDNTIFENNPQSRKKNVKFNLCDKQPEKIEIHNDDNVKSSFEERQERLKTHLEKLENNMLSEKPWQMKGEVSAKKRPANSLLEEILEFDVNSRPAPIITEEAAMKLDDIIIRRIKDKAWDDVEKKMKPIIDVSSKFTKKLVLNQEKSKLSLAQIYEQAYLKQKSAVSDKNICDEKDTEPKKHKELKHLLDSLFRKLDSLSNYHYTPIPAIPETKILNNLPSLKMEETIPNPP